MSLILMKSLPMTVSRVAIRAPRAQTARSVVVRSIESKRPEEASASRDGEPSTSAGPAPGGLTQEEMDKLAAMRQNAREKQAAENRGFVGIAVDTAQLIEWPSPGQAVIQTLQVYLILIVSTGMLFGMNVLLNKIFSP